MRILIIEDEVIISTMLSEGLKEHGYQCDSAETLKDGMYYLNIRYYDLVLLDWSLPDGNAIDILEDIKSNSPGTAFIILSSSKENANEIKAFRKGADDYIRKPFDFDVLIARIAARVRYGGNSIIVINDLSINPEEEIVTYRDNEVMLKGKPFEVLHHIACHRNTIVSREQLLDAIWVEPDLITPNVIEVAIQQIRSKVDKPLGITTIETVRRRGYRFCFPK